MEIQKILKLYSLQFNCDQKQPLHLFLVLQVIVSNVIYCFEHLIVDKVFDLFDLYDKFVESKKKEKWEFHNKSNLLGGFFDNIFDVLVVNSFKTLIKWIL